MPWSSNGTYLVTVTDREDTTGLYTAAVVSLPVGDGHQVGAGAAPGHAPLDTGSVPT